MSLAEMAAGLDGAFTSIPIIDLGNCDTLAGRLSIASQIRNACMRVGFFYLRNHGIPQPCLDNVFTATQTYFDLPMDTKMKLHHKKVGSFKGYKPPSDLNLSENRQKDFIEAFVVGWEETEAKEHHEKKETDDLLAPPNVWPLDDHPGFREACLRYYHAVAAVGKALFPLFALALGLPETFFDDKTQDSTPFMKVMHYPSKRDGPPNADNDVPSGVGAHTDFQCFTLLWQQPGIQALQIMNSEKEWVDAPAIEDTLVINIGDQLSMWTNDIFKSDVHRVVNNSGKDRYSIALFVGTDHRAIIETLPTCVNADRPARYSPIIAGEYVQKQIREAYPEA